MKRLLNVLTPKNENLKARTNSPIFILTIMNLLLDITTIYHNTSIGIKFRFKETSSITSKKKKVYDHAQIIIVIRKLYSISIFSRFVKIYRNHQLELQISYPLSTFNRL